MIKFRLLNPDKEQPTSQKHTNSAEKFHSWHLRLVTWGPLAGYLAIPLAALTQTIPYEYGRPSFIGLMGGHLLAYAHYRVLWEHLRKSN